MNELSLYILDIVQNSLKADSKNVQLIINEDKVLDLLIVTVIDDGKGIKKEQLEKITSPFYTTRTTRKVGLGIPLFKELCELCEGNLKIESEVGKGTTLIATFKLNSIDLPPLGNIIDTLYLLIINEENVDIKYTHIRNGKEFSFDTKEIKEILDGISIKEPSIMTWFKNYVKEGLEELN